MPATGALAQVFLFTFQGVCWWSWYIQAFGHKLVTLVSITIFSLGCVLCGAATSMAMLITGQSEFQSLISLPLLISFILAIQGLGGAGIFTTSATDLVPLSDCGLFNGLYQMYASRSHLRSVLILKHVSTWCLASTIGAHRRRHAFSGQPVEMGLLWVSWHHYQSFIQNFALDLNLPLALVAAVLVSMCLHLKTPGRTWAEIIDLMDWTFVLNVLRVSTLPAHLFFQR